MLLFHLSIQTLRSEVSTGLLCGQSIRKADAKAHVIAVPSSPPEQFNEWWQSQTTVKMVTSVWVTGWPQIKSVVKVQGKNDFSQMWLLSDGWCPDPLVQPFSGKDGRNGKLFGWMEHFILCEHVCLSEQGRGCRVSYSSWNVTERSFVAERGSTWKWASQTKFHSTPFRVWTVHLNIYLRIQTETFLQATEHNG